MTEKEIENQILYYLSFVKGAKFWKVDTVGVFDPRKKVFRKKNTSYRIKGVSDIIGFYMGKFIAFEIKTPKRKKAATIEQLEFIQAANTNNQMGLVVTSLDEVINIIKDMK